MSSPMDFVTTFWEKLQEAKSALPAGTDDYSQKLDSAIQEICLQHMATGYISARVLGRDSWTPSTPAQRQAFSEALAFQRVLSKILCDSIDKEKASMDANPVTRDHHVVSVKFTDAGDTTMLRFHLMNANQERWLIFDIGTEDFSCLDAVRNGLQHVVGAQGLDEAIMRLKQRNV